MIKTTPIISTYIGRTFCNFYAILLERIVLNSSLFSLLLKPHQQCDINDLSNITWEVPQTLALQVPLASEVRLHQALEDHSC